MLPLASARSSVSAARDGAGTTTTSTELLTMVVGPRAADELHLGAVADRGSGRRRGGRRGEQQRKQRTLRKTGVNKRRGRSSFALLRPAEEE